MAILTVENVNLSVIDGWSESEFIKHYKTHYRFLAPDKIDSAIKADYAEIKKHFTKGDKVSDKKAKK